MPLNILIIGAGLSGLAAAAFLRKHHTVTLLEQSTLDFDRNDYGLSVIANAYSLLLRLGIRKEALDMAVMTKVWQRTAQNQEIVSMEFETRKTFGAKSVLTRRALLQGELFRLATSAKLEGSPAKVVEGVRVESINAITGEVRSVTGTIYTGGLLIGADGIHSSARSAVLSAEGVADKPAPAASHDLCAYMAQIPISTLHTSPSLSFFASPSTSAGLVSWITSPSSKTRILAYHISPSIAQIVGYTSEEEFSQQFDEQNVSILKNIPASRAKHAFADFSPDITSLFDHHRTGDGTVEVWRIRDLDPLPTWYKGKTLLIGDACHALTPHAGQGCNISIEDAEALGIVLQDVEDESGLETAIARFLSIRKDRAEFIAKSSRHMGGLLGPDAGPLDRAEVARRTYSYRGAEEALKGLEGS